MCKCSFVLAACLTVACLAAATSAQDYSAVQSPSDEAPISARSAQPSMIFDTNEMVVNPGEPLNLKCGVGGEFRYCVWSHDPDFYQVEDVYSGLSQGLREPDDKQNNQCGIVVDSVNIEHHGEWTCRVFVPGNTLSSSKKVVVTIKPTPPIIEIQSSRLEVGTTEDTTVRCSVAAARPAVDMKWFLGDEDITAMSEKEETLTDDQGTYKSTSILTRRFQPADDHKTLMCSITHIALVNGANSSVPVTVLFKPTEKAITTFYQIQLGSNYEVKFNLSSNPKPIELIWKFGDNVENPEESLITPDSRGRYRTYLEELDNNMYTAKLLIEEFTLEDSEKKYSLLVHNEIGETEYQIRLSVHEAPKDTLSGGAIAGIIIVIVVVVVAIVAAGYARYRQMFCFASRAESKAHIQDPERNETDNGTANDAIKASTDHVNGKTENTVANGNGNLEQTQVDEVNNEKKNTDV